MNKFLDLLIGKVNLSEEEKKRRNVRACIFTVLLALFLCIYYVTMYNYSFSQGVIGFDVVNVMNILVFFPHWMGIAVLIIFARYNSILLKIFHLIIYLYLIFVSLFMSFVMQHAYELLIYAPHLIVFLLLVLVSIRRRKRLKEEVK